MIDDFLIRAALAGVGLSIAAGPLGAMVVWRRMAYFGDATSHAALLGVALALALELPLGLGTLAVAVLMALMVSSLANRGWAVDTTLGVLSHSALAFGLVAVSLLAPGQADLSGLLMGDILSVSWDDLIWIWGGSILVAAILAWRWQALLTATLSEDLAHAAGINPARERLILTLALALMVAIAIKIVGALLIAAMLIIPAASARALSRSPEAMAINATLFGAFASLAGLGLSLSLDSPAGPSVVTAAALCFSAALVIKAFRRG